MQLFRTIAAAFSMFSAIPVPQTPWNTRTTRYLLCAFPLVGVVIGFCCIVWEAVCDALSLPAILRGAGWTLLPVALTGGLHLDGYADTVDALASHAAPARRREILRDPHCGAFAVIALCAYFAGTFALCASLRSCVTLWPAFALSRALSGVALTLLPLSDGSTLARMFVEASDRRRVRTALLAEAVAASLSLLTLDAFAGAVTLLAAAAVLTRYVVVATRDFGGTSGDLAGWFLQKAEFWMLAALTLAQYWEATA